MKKILIIDDSEDMHFLYKMMLKNHPFEVNLSFDGEDGVFKFQNTSPDLILVDFHMPGMNGIDVTKKIREHEKKLGTNKSKIMIVSAELNEKLFVDAGADGQLAKPFEKEDLEKVLEI